MREKVNPSFEFHNVSKLTLFEILNNEFKLDEFKLGFDHNHLPDK